MKSKAYDLSRVERGERNSATPKAQRAERAGASESQNKTQTSAIRPLTADPRRTARPNIARHREFAFATPEVPESSRTPWERIMQIHELIHAGGFPNATLLSNKLRLTVKTIHRDMAYMRDHLGLPLAFDSRRNGYYYTRALPSGLSQQVSEVELFALLIAARTINQYAGTSVEQPLRAAFRKFLPQLESVASIVVEDLPLALSRATRPADASVLAAFEKLVALHNSHSLAA